MEGVKLRPLEEMFTNPGELRAAEKLLSAVPEDVAKRRLCRIRRVLCSYAAS